MRDSLNLIQRNDLGAEWIDHHDDLLLSFILLFGMVNLRDLPIERDDILRLKKKLQRMSSLSMGKSLRFTIPNSKRMIIVSRHGGQAMSH